MYNLFTPNTVAIPKTAKNTILEYVFDYDYIESSWLLWKHQYGLKCSQFSFQMMTMIIKKSAPS